MKRVRVIAVSVSLMLLAACGGPIYTTNAGPTIPPAVTGMEWVSQPPATQQCAMGLMVDGTAAVVSSYNWPAGFAADWLTWKIGFDGPPGHSLAECWNVAQWNWPNGFNLYTQCWGQPVLKSTWNDFGAASAWVQVPYCQCNMACQQFMGWIQPFWREPMRQCSFVLDWDWMCSIPQRGNMAETEVPETQPLPAEFTSPGWDVNVPIPPDVPQPIVN